jgi:hypothetical protein
MYSKITTVTGLTRDRAELDALAVASIERGDWLTANSFNCPHKKGFWKTETIVKHARKHGAVGVITVKHQLKYSISSAWRVVTEMKIDVATGAVVA